MRFILLTKRRYTNKDLLNDRFGRNFHLPIQLGLRGHGGMVLAADYDGQRDDGFEESNVQFRSFRLAPRSLRIQVPIRGIRAFKPDVVIANGDVHLGVMGSLIARRLSVPFVYDLYDNYESFASARIPGVRLAHRRTVRKSDLVVCVSPGLYAHVRGISRHAVVVGNGVDPETFYPRDRLASRRRLGISPDEPVLGYVGGISDGRGIDFVLQGVGAVRAMGTSVRLVLLGVDTSRLDLDEPWIMHLPAVEQRLVPSVISAFDVAVWPYVANSWGRFVHPNKLGEYLACGVPVLATDLPEFRLVAPYPGIAWYKHGDPGDFALALLRQLKAPSEVSLPSALTWRSQGQLLEGALRNLVQPVR